MERHLLKKGDTLTLAAKDGSESEFTILEYVGDGSDCVCYFAKNEETSGRLKEFSPLETLTYEEYLERRENFSNNFKILEEARNSQEGQVLNNCLPVQDIRYCNERLFVWSPQDRHGITLAEYLQRVPQEQRSLSDLLRITMTVGSFLKTIHILGLVHCDVKPSNILVTTNANKTEINPSNLTVFDSGSVINLLKSTSPSSGGTKGYVAPELSYRVGNHCDIYSLGAVLFNAITDKLFCKEDYALLPQYVALSFLTRDLNIKSQRLLTKILQEALAPLIRNRYVRVSDMLEDIRRLEKNMTALSPKKDDLSMKILLQNLLYKNPLELKKRNIFVAVVGAGSLAQKFIDQILQIQVPYLNANGTFSERKLCLKAFSLEADSDRETYLKARPALKSFVRFQGEEPTEACYAELDFCATPNVQGRAFSSSVEINRKLAQKIISNFDEELDYVFVALGDDELNQAVAAVFVDSLSCPVTFISQATPTVTDSQLEKMAFNVHLSWLGSLSGVDLNDVREEYLQRYYDHESSLNFAISIRYKLEALGISLEDNLIVAQQFEEKIKNRDIVAPLSMYEHRRWLLEKVSLGWRTQKDIEYSCLNSLRRNGKPQSDIERLHHCLVPCGKEQTLLEKPEKWNEPLDETLDPLDKMSVTLHQALLRESVRLKRIDFKSYLKSLRDALGSFETQIDKFEWLLKEIWTGNVYHSRRFKSYFKKFKNSLPENIVQAATESLDLIFRTFIIIAESNLCRDYKANDKILIENIAFILTYEQPLLAMAFDDRENLLNVASPTILNPKKLRYLYCFDKKSQRTKDLIQRLQALHNYFAERKIRAEMTFVIAVLPTGKFEEREFRAAFPEMELEVQSCRDSQVATEFFLEKLRKGNYLFDGSTKLFRLLGDQSEFTKKISVCLSYFEFDMMTKKFVSSARDCEFLNYINDDANFQVKDIFSLQTIEMQAGAAIEAFHYEKLLQIFKANLQVLVMLEKSSCEDGIINLNLQTRETPVTLNYFFSESFALKVESFLTELKSQRVIQDFKMRHDGDVTFEIVTVFEIENLIEKVLWCFERNMTVEVKKEDDTVKILYRSLSASIECSDENNNIAKILKELATKHFIRDLRFEDRALFSYASEAVKTVLTNSQKALEIFLYLTIFRIGFFDEITCDIKFQWVNHQRFSMMLTKGFSNVILQVSRNENLAALYEFSTIADKVGLNSKKVFVLLGNADDKFKELAEKLEIFLIQSDHFQTAERLTKII